MKTPSGTFIVIVLALIAIVSILIFQACATGPDRGRQDNKYLLKIGKDPDSFVDFKDNPNEGKNRFDAVLRRLDNGNGTYEIRYLAKDGGTPVEHYHPPHLSLKTNKVTTSELAKNEPPGDPNITQRIQSNDAADIQKALNSLQE
jgi:hypothetical protein